MENAKKPEYEIKGKDGKPKKVNFRRWWKTTWKLSRWLGPKKCVICGKPLYRNNPKQKVLYCSKPCRHRRHKKGDVK